MAVARRLAEALARESPMQHSRTLKGSAVLVGLTALALCACSSDESSGGNGVTPLASGGAVAAGGVSATGGAVGTGGSVSAPSGGKVGVGGSAEGGSSAPTTTGGTRSGSGGSGTGGVGMDGGGKSNPGMGGATGGLGGGGALAGGNPGTAGTPSGGSGGCPRHRPAIRSPRLAAARRPRPPRANTQNAPRTLDVDGTERKFWIQLPAAYDPAGTIPRGLRVPPTRRQRLARLSHVPDPSEVSRRRST